MRTRTKTTLFGAVSLIAAAGLTGAIALPANADPTFPNPANESQELALVGVGSDTIQDLFSGLTQAVTDGSNNQVFASYDATGTPQIKTRVLGQQFDRPNGSGAGLTALKSAAVGATGVNNSVTGTPVPVVLRGSDVQFARSSSYNSSTLATNGRYAQIPIAVDAVTYATSGTTTSHIPSGIPEGGTPSAGLGTIASPDPLTLSNIFDGKGYLSGAVGGTSYQFFSGSGASSDQVNWPKLDAYVPQLNSGTRNFWFQALTLGAPGTLPNGVLDTYNGGTTNEEHDGSAIQSDPLGIEPFSIAQWTAQSNSANINGIYGTAITDRRHGVLLNSVGSVAPTVSGKLNTAFPISRPVFVDVEFAQLKINPLLEAVFVNDSNFAANSTIYNATNPLDGTTSVITDFGFAKIPAGGFTTPVYSGVTFKQGDAQDYRFN
jgi:hypothetical protein